MRVWALNRERETKRERDKMFLFKVRRRKGGKRGWRCGEFRLKSSGIGKKSAWKSFLRISYLQ